MATFVVDYARRRAYDGGDGGTDLSLREALALANADPGSDTITFAPASPASTIAADERRSSRIIADDVIINGDIDGDNVADITVSGNDAQPRVQHRGRYAATTITAN